jgi:hypothetical protein
MLKKISVLFFALAFVAMLSSCGPAIDEELVGKWRSVVLPSLSIEFTSDGYMRGYSSETQVSEFKYEASGGSGTRWVEGKEDAKQSFTYSISGNTLMFTLDGGGTSEWERI